MQHDMISLQDSIDKLSAYGYEPDPVNLEEAVVKFQGFNGLEQSGELNDDTLAKLHVARCSCPDFAQSEDAIAAWPSSMKDANGVYQIRTRHDITGLNPLTAEQEQAAWLEAIGNLNAVCGINLTVQQVGHVHISAEVGAMGSGTLAYSFLPIGASAKDTMDQRYNRAVNWSYKLLMQVITHEIGHALGLSHGPPGSLLQPTASGNILKPQAWDIAELQKRYGPPKQIAPPPTGDGKISMPVSNSIQVMAQEAGTFQLNLTSQSPKVAIPSSNKIEVTVSKSGTYDVLLVPKLSNIHI